MFTSQSALDPLQLPAIGKVSKFDWSSHVSQMTNAVTAQSPCDPIQQYCSSISGLISPLMFNYCHSSLIPLITLSLNRSPHCLDPNCPSSKCVCPPHPCILPSVCIVSPPSPLPVVITLANPQHSSHTSQQLLC